MRQTIIALCLFATCLWMAGDAPAQDWPCYGGPNHNGAIDDAAVAPDPKAMAALWKAPMLGRGFSGLAVVDGKVFFLDRRGTGDAGQDVLRVLELATGKALREYSHLAPGDTDEDKTGLRARTGPVSVPTVTATHVYFAGAKGVLYCIDRRTHRLAWKRDLRVSLNWKVYSLSRLLIDDLVVVSGTLEEGGDMGKAFRAADGDP